MKGGGIPDITTDEGDGSLATISKSKYATVIGKEERCGSIFNPKKNIPNQDVVNQTGPINRTVDDKELLKGLKEGREWAFRILVRQYQERLFRLSYGITLDREESLDIVQDVFVSVVKNIENFRGDTGLYTWLRSVTINICLNWKRKWARRFRWKHQPMTSEAQGTPSPGEQDKRDPETVFKEKELEEAIMKEVDKLPAKIRTVFVLRTLEGLPYQEIAQTLGIKTGTVKSRLHQARKHLQEAIHERK